ncbi:uncharacterized protein LOC120786066 isoform X2 [Xiphias gladius]|uniref:uncharacterized protein LOC120786066 isoform X2 n=1 Tax=Xiphias gladius TaxID=8245 RepID=UPI001A9821CA|nr:uncharacterized protein LOC120786066 isoform X2 [Xiphias gladius]
MNHKGELGTLKPSLTRVFGQGIHTCRLPPPAPIRVSVPEDHHVCLRCGGSDGSHVVWTHRDRLIAVTERDSYVENGDRQRLLLRPDGGLCLRQLDAADNGEYRCNRLLVAELQVLTGRDFAVSAGRTLLLPCSHSSKPRQRWFHRRQGGRREAVLTRFRNGTVKPERDGSRLGFADDALQIRDLRPEDAGEYQCNGELQGRVTVLTGGGETTGKEKKRRETALLTVAVAGFGLTVLLVIAVCALLTGMKCRRRRKHRYAAAQRRGYAELQPRKTSGGPTGCEAPESPSPPEETIHYASLGRQSWRERPGRTPPDRDRRHVIYSSVITRPAV